MIQKYQIVATVALDCRVRINLQLESSLYQGCIEKIFKQECYLMFIEAQVIHN